MEEVLEVESVGDKAIQFDVQTILLNCLGQDGNIKRLSRINIADIDKPEQIDCLKCYFFELIKLIAEHVAVINNEHKLKSTKALLLQCYSLMITELQAIPRLEETLFQNLEQRARFHLHLVFSGIKSTIRSYKKHVKNNPLLDSVDVILSKEMLHEVLCRLDLCQNVLGFTEAFKKTKELAEQNYPTREQIENLLRWLKTNDITTERGWNNFMESFPLNRAIVVEVDREDQVAAIVKKVNSLNEGKKFNQRLTIRAAAGWKNTFELFKCFALTRRGMENKYNESFSATEGALASVIIRFSPRYQNHIQVNQDVNHPTVDIPAGVQIEKVDNVLWDTGQGYSLTTASMIRWVTAVGLAANAGYGTGMHQTAFAGLIKSFVICDFKGDIYELSEIGEGDKAIYEKKQKNAHGDFEKVNDNNDCKQMFEAIRGAHLGLWGIVLKVRLKCRPKMYLKDERIPFQNIDQLANELKDKMCKSEYMTIFAFAPYRTHTEADKVKYPTLPHQPDSQHPFALCLWNEVPENEALRQGIDKPDEFLWKFKHEFLVESGDSILRLLNDCPKLTPLFMHFAATVELGAHKKEYIGESRHVMHAIPTFPNGIAGCCLLFPVTLDNCVDKVVTHLKFINSKLLEYATRDEYPVSLATYVRFIKGTNGGLSSSSTQPGEYIISIETFTQRDNPTFSRFRGDLVDYFLKNEPRVKFHLGKYIPKSLSFQGIYSPEEFNSFFEQLELWHGGLENFERSPFLTPFFASKIFDHKVPLLSQVSEHDSKPEKETDPVFMMKVIEKLTEMEQSRFNQYGAHQTPDDPRYHELVAPVQQFRVAVEKELNQVQQHNQHDDQAIQQQTQQAAQHK